MKIIANAKMRNLCFIQIKMVLMYTFYYETGNVFYFISFQFILASILQITCPV